MSLITFLIRAASLKEQGEGCRWAGGAAALCHLQGSVPGEEGPKLNRRRCDLVGCWEAQSPDFAEGNEEFAFSNPAETKAERGDDLCL